MLYKTQILKGKIGLEIHTYLITKEKLFCECSSSREKGLTPNTNICPICTAQPGAKPMLPNEEAVKNAVKIGLMLQCKINEEINWQRKHYSWPDLPKGYQNTLSGPGTLPVGTDGKFLGITISSMHLEEDPASWEPSTGKIDYNRSGLPLVEIVTAPEFETSEQVIEWLKKLVHYLTYLKCVDSNAGIKVDVNVSIPKKTERVEIKNVSSIEDIGKAINYEIQRQLKEGSERETRRFDSEKEKTIRMRGKEEAEDYRFISDPDLKLLRLDKIFVEKIKENLPENPEEKLQKFIKQHKISKNDSEILAKNLDIAEFFEKVSEKIKPEFALPWINIELLRHLNYNKTTLDKVEIEPEHFIKLLYLVKEKKITELQAKQILNKFYPKSFDPSLNIKEKITDEKEIEKIARKAIEKNKKSAEDYLKGEEKAFNYLMGEIMRISEKRADYTIARKILLKILEK